MPTVQIEKRDGGNPDTLRKKGRIPGVIYGPKEASQAISVDQKVFEKLWKEAGESTIVTLEGVGESKDALIHEVDFNPVTDVARHVDFYVIEKGKKVETQVPLVFVGEAPAVKNLGGTLMKVMHEVKVEAFPKDLPHEILIDVSTLETFESRIAIKDIPVPAGVTILEELDETVISVSQPKEEEETPVAEIDMESIEVEKKGKKEEEGEATEDTAEKSQA
jgi:large subunit ribosomal protein L25